MNLIKTVKSRGLLWVTVHTSLWLFDKFFDFILYPSAIVRFGLVGGTAAMMLLSFLVCWALIVLYDWASNNMVRDALGFETVKDASEEFKEWLATRWPFRNRRIAAGSSTFKALAFVYLSLWHDPMTCAILMRPAYMHRLGRKEWATFLGSVALSNASWGLMVWVGVETVQALFPAIWDKLT